MGFTALAWTSVLLFTGIGLRSELRFFPRYRPWMYLGAATLFTVVHTLHMAIIWDFHYRGRLPGSAARPGLGWASSTTAGRGSGPRWLGPADS